MSTSDQAKRIFDSRKQHNINTESWIMAGDPFFIMHCTITEQPFTTNYSPKISHRIVSINTSTIAVETSV